MKKGKVTKFVYDDGGRVASGFKSKRVDDCVCRAISIVTKKPYHEVHTELSSLGWVEEGRYWRDPADGLFIPVEEADRRERKYIASLGWHWVPTMHIGSGCKVHLRADELPGGQLVVALSRHWVAVIDGVVHDTYDCTRG